MVNIAMTSSLDIVNIFFYVLQEVLIHPFALADQIDGLAQSVFKVYL